MNEGFTVVRINKLMISFGNYDQRIKFIDDWFRTKIKEQLILGYCNAHTVVHSKYEDQLHSALKSFSILFADGVGVRYAAKILDSKNINYEAQNATDFNEALFRYANAKRLRVFLIGTTDEILECAVKNIKNHYGEIDLVGWHSGYFESTSTDICEKINRAAPDLLIVGMGHPKQEKWVSNEKNNLHVPIIVVVGGYFDFISGAKPRAPKIIRQLRLEWLYRVFLEPRRLWKRYILGIPHFLAIVLMEKIRR